MPKLHRIKKAGKSKYSRKCKACGHEIQPGEPYKYADKRLSPRGFASVRVFWCKDHSPDKYEFVRNENTRAIMMLQDSIDEALAEDFDADGVQEMAENFAEEVEGMGEEWREKADNVEMGFGHPTEVSEELAERAEIFAQAAEALREIPSQADAMPEEGDDEDDGEETLEDRVEAWRDNVRGLFSEAVGEL